MLTVLKTVLHYEKRGGRIIEDNFLKSSVAIQEWFLSNQNMQIALGVTGIMNAWRHKEEDETDLESGWVGAGVEGSPYLAPALQQVRQRLSCLTMRTYPKRRKMKGVRAWMKSISFVSHIWASH